MSQRTDMRDDSQTPEITNEYLYTLGGITLAVLVVVFGVEHGFGVTREFRSIFQVVLAFPWIVAGGITIANGLAAFTGKEAEVLSGTAYWGPLVPLLIAVIAFTLFLLFMSSKEIRKGLPQPHRFAYLAGLILSAIFFFTLLPVTVIQISVRDSLRTAQAVQEDKDAIINDMARIAWRIREHTILPARYGGGQGDIRSFKIPERVLKRGNATYVIEWEGDTAVIIARSVAYNDATARIRVDRSGDILGWEYSGRFE